MTIPSSGQKDKSASEQIDDIIKKAGDWRGEKLSQLRTMIRQASPSMVEEVKWKKPSRPEGAPVWSNGKIVCIGELLKGAVRLTFPKGAQLTDAKHLFNARRDSNSVRAIDFFKDDGVDESALEELVLEAVKLNE